MRLYQGLASGESLVFAEPRSTVALTPMQEELCAQSRWDFSDLRALFINCTLKRSPEVSNTEGLANISMEIMRRQGGAVESIRAVDHAIASGVWPDKTEHGWERDEWPAISEQVMAADILVLSTPIWLGEKSSVCTQSSSFSTATPTC
jgi:hypothetical protein